MLAGPRFVGARVLLPTRGASPALPALGKGLGGGQAEEEGHGGPEAWSPGQTPNSAPGSWARVTEGRTEEGKEDGIGRGGAE